MAKWLVSGGIMKRSRRGLMPLAVAVAFIFCYDTFDLGVRCFVSVLVSRFASVAQLSPGLKYFPMWRAHSYLPRAILVDRVSPSRMWGLFVTFFIPSKVNWNALIYPRF